MNASEFKKLLIDLGLTTAEIARQIDVSRWLVGLYFRGQRCNTDRRRQIKSILTRRACERGIELPEFWQDAA